MRDDLRRALSLAGLAAVVALTLGLAATTARTLVESRDRNHELETRLDALQAREKRLAANSARETGASRLFEAETVTLAAAAMQQRLEAAVTKANGRLVSAKVESAARGDPRRLALSADLSIAEPDMQALLFDLETGRPYLFIDALEARAPERVEGQGVRTLSVSLAISGEWSGAK